MWMCGVRKWVSKHQKKWWHFFRSFKQLVERNNSTLNYNLQLNNFIAILHIFATIQFYINIFNLSNLCTCMNPTRFLRTIIMNLNQINIYLICLIKNLWIYKIFLVKNSQDGHKLVLKRWPRIFSEYFLCYY